MIGERRKFCICKKGCDGDEIPFLKDLTLHFLASYLAFEIYALISIIYIFTLLQVNMIV